MYSRKSPMGCS